ncbi:MAG: bisanhydrobacterioruberin hydratase CruF [Rhodothermales bacterium]|nr:bisanhydrobacterioruberin hydratase CruF [Rhodothermales bacterium]
MSRSVTSPSRPLERAFAVAFGVFCASILFSVAGTLLMSFFPREAAVALAWIAQHLGLSLLDMVKGSTWVYMALMPLLTLLLYLPVLGLRRSVLFLLWGSAIGAAAELLGTTTGLPFGPYAYTDLLGAKIAGHVPWFIPPSWYAMSLLSFDLAGRLGVGRWGRIGTTALFMVLWDVALDPAMTTDVAVGRSFWTYAGGGAYFGMPLINWVGWLLTSLVIAWGYDRLLGGLDYAAPWAPALYAVNVLFPVFICFAYGAALAGLLGLAALALVLGLVRRRGSVLLPARRRPHPLGA